MAVLKAGVPWDVAISLDSEMMDAMMIAAGIADGAEFNWDAGNWRTPGVQ